MRSNPLTTGWAQCKQQCVRLCILPPPPPSLPLLVHPLPLPFPRHHESCALCSHRKSLDGFNECVTYDDFSFLQVCDVITGRTGLNAFIDQNCTEVASEGAALPSCTQVSSSAECDDGLGCTQMAECVDAGACNKANRQSASKCSLQ